MENELAKKIKEARTAKGLSQDALADKSNVSLRTIQRVEKGIIPRNSTLIILCEVLELDFNQFVNQNTSDETDREIRKIKQMNLSIILLIVIPFANIIAPLLFWKLGEKLNQLDYQAGKVVSLQIIWSLLTIFIFFATIFISSLITGTAGEGHYWAFISYLICLIWNLAVVSISTNKISVDQAKFLSKTPNFF